MSAASVISPDSDCGTRRSLATIATRTSGVLGARRSRNDPSRKANAKTPTAIIAGGIQSMFHRRRYHATASPAGSSDMMKVMPAIPSHDARCSIGKKSTYEYAGLRQAPGGGSRAREKYKAASKVG